MPKSVISLISLHFLIDVVCLTCLLKSMAKIVLGLKPVKVAVLSKYKRSFIGGLLW